MDIRNTIQWGAGMLSAAVLVYMSYMSMQQDFKLSTPVILGMLGLIILLIYGKEPLIRFVEAWKHVPASNRYGPSNGDTRREADERSDTTGDSSPTTDTTERDGYDR